MFRFAVACTLATAEAQGDHPHLSQAWQALSTGDGLPDTVGFESYIYEDCPGKHGGSLFTEDCMSGHVFDYGADNCIKFEVNMGLKSKYTGTYYVKCDSVDCCKDASTQSAPDVKKWDIGQAKKSEVTHMEATDLDDLDGHVAGADTWNEFINAFGAFSVNYTYYITQSENGDVISHAIDYSAPGAAPGRILYGNFTAKHADELDAFREVFKAPAQCLKNNVLHCNDAHVQKWDPNVRRGLVAEPTAVATAEAQGDDHPHLSQAWQALSSGDGLPDTVGKESYIYEDCPGKYGGSHFTEDCMSGHVFDYGADNCIKYEVNMGVKSPYTGTYYVKCDSVDCCYDEEAAIPDIKKWDIGQNKKSEITHMEGTDLDDLDGHVAGADTWNEFINAFGAFSVNYTYYITQSENGDVISHAIDYSAPGAAPGRILYGNFTAKHADELDAFREVFKAPAQCLKNNVLKCNDAHVQKWDPNARRGLVAQPKPVAV